MINDLDHKIKESKKVIRFAVKKWHPNIGAAFTGRKDSSVMMHLIISVTKNKIPVMFIDHGLHFREAYRNLDKLEKLWDLDLRIVADPKLLNKLRAERTKRRKLETLRKLKIRTIEGSIKQYKWKALFTAIRRDENPARSDEKYFSKRSGHYRTHPLLHWTESEVWEYIRINNIPYISLYDQGYRSLGDKLSTRKSSIGTGERAGREQEKEEIMEKLRSLGYF